MIKIPKWDEDENKEGERWKKEKDEVWKGHNVPELECLLHT